MYQGSVTFYFRSLQTANQYYEPLAVGNAEVDVN